MNKEHGGGQGGGRTHFRPANEPEHEPSGTRPGTANSSMNTITFNCFVWCDSLKASPCRQHTKGLKIPGPSSNCPAPKQHLPPVYSPPASGLAQQRGVRFIPSLCKLRLLLLQHSSQRPEMFIRLELAPFHLLAVQRCPMLSTRFQNSGQMLKVQVDQGKIPHLLQFEMEMTTRRRKSMRAHHLAAVQKSVVTLRLPTPFNMYT